MTKFRCLVDGASGWVFNDKANTPQNITQCIGIGGEGTIVHLYKYHHHKIYNVKLPTVQSAIADF